MEIINGTCQSLEPCLLVQFRLGSRVCFRPSRSVGSARRALCASWQVANKSCKAGVIFCGCCCGYHVDIVDIVGTCRAR